MDDKQKRSAYLSCSRGMTLLEMLMVVAILSSVAWVAMGTVSNNTGQIRFEDTRNRLEAIKRAIIGDTSRTLNGRSEIRGYVADMGELPANLNALVVKDYCSADPQYTDQASCNAAMGAGSWTVQQAYAYDGTHDLWSGWNGPYLAASPSLTPPRYQKYRDGWGNDDGSNDFGWSVGFNDADNTDDADGDGDGSNDKDNLLVVSYGLDNASGGIDYEADYPSAGSDTLIELNKHRTLITDSGGTGGITIDFSTPNLPNPVNQLCLKIALRRNGSVTELDSSDTYVAAWDGTPRTNLFHFTSIVVPPNNTFSPMGQMAYRVYEYSGGSCGPTVYPAGSPWKLFTLIPGVALQPLQWPVP